MISMMGSAKSELPDPIGGARLLEPIKKMFPEINVDTEPLYEEAEELNKRIGTKPSLPAESDDRVLYG